MCFLCTTHVIIQRRGELVMKSFLKRKQVQVIVVLVIAIAVLAMVVGLGLSTGIARAAAPSYTLSIIPPVTLQSNSVPPNAIQVQIEYQCPTGAIVFDQ